LSSISPYKMSISSFTSTSPLHRKKKEKQPASNCGESCSLESREKGGEKRKGGGGRAVAEHREKKEEKTTKGRRRKEREMPRHREEKQKRKGKRENDQRAPLEKGEGGVLETQPVPRELVKEKEKGEGTSNCHHPQQWKSVPPSGCIAYRGGEKGKKSRHHIFRQGKRGVVFQHFPQERGGERGGRGGNRPAKSTGPEKQKRKGKGKQQGNFFRTSPVERERGGKEEGETADALSVIGCSCKKRLGFWPYERGPR